MSSKLLAATLATALLGTTALIATPTATTAQIAAPDDAGTFEEAVLWDPAVDGHANYHVHGLAVTPDDTVLAFTEARYEISDGAPKDILLRRSTDGGQTWEPNQIVVASDGETWGNPTPVVDEQTGDVFLIYQGPTSTEVKITSSSDAGLTWSAPTDLTHLFADDPYGWVLNGMGPGHGIQLESGRLLVPMPHRRTVTLPAAQRRYGIDVMYSDDHGATWHRGGEVPVSPEYPINESRMYQRDDGAVVVNGRAAAGGTRLRISSVSHDDGATWSEPVLEPATDSYTAVDSSVLRYEGDDDVTRILHSRPASARRENLTVAVSYDEGYTYRHERLIHAGPSYYSDLATLSDGTILAIYGRDGDILAFPGRVAVARFDLEWLTQGADDGTRAATISEQAVELGSTEGVRTGTSHGPPDIVRVSPDVSGAARHGRVVGNPTIVEGAVGSALDLAAESHLEVAPSPELFAAGREFTAAGWFRTEATTSQAIMWAYAMGGGGTPQWWIRAEPNNNRLRAFVGVGNGTTGISASGNYADGTWHHVAFTRDLDTVRLYLDGELVGEKASRFGSASVGAVEGVHVGQRPDGANPFDGALDELLWVNRALDASEVTELAGGSSYAGDDALMSLPMDETEADPHFQRPRVVDDANARGGQYLHYIASEPGDYVEIPFTAGPNRGPVEVAIRLRRTWGSGKVQVSVDGTELPAGLIDPTLGENEGFQTYQLGTLDLSPGQHTVRFTLVEPGWLGGMDISPDHLMTTSGWESPPLVRDTVADDTSSGSEPVTGQWGRATGQPGHPYHGVSYRFAPPGNGERAYRWRPDVPTAGSYNVLAWWVSHPNRATDAPVTIHHANGSTTVDVDQQGQARSLSDPDHPGVWVDLGTYRFDAGSASTIEMSNDADGFVIADAVMLTRDHVPATPTNVHAAGVSPASIEVGWTQSEGATSYHIERRPAGDDAWQYAGRVAGDLGSFTSTGLSPDTAYEHRVYAAAETVADLAPRGSVATEPVAATTLPAGDGENDEALRLATMSGRPDTVSGGQALVRIDVGDELAVGDVTVTLNDLDVTDDLVADENARTLTGVVGGLNVGSNILAATVAGRRSELELRNHPNEGPVFSGPHQQPFDCETTSFTMPVVGGNLGDPIDENCSIETRVDYFYRTTSDSYAPWPAGTSSYPVDLATTTTSDGAETPFIVRMETGTVNRAIYQHTVLHDPLAEPEPDFASPPSAWNGAAIFTFGAGCTNGWYRQGRNTGGVTDAFMLGQGFAVMSSSLNVFGSNCSDLTAAESAMMVKERFVEAYGPVGHTIGIGCSGGSYQAHQITDNYPGILDGIITGCSFPDVGFSTVNVITDAWLLDTYFESAALDWTEEEKRAVTGFATYATAPNVANGARRIDPRAFCSSVPTGQRYHPDTNPTGVRCGVYDHAVNVYGSDPSTGFARRPLDNVGIQYGLGALNDGTITPEQFLDLNEHVGGFDDDANIRSERTTGALDAIRIAYETGRLTNGGGGLANVPIIDYRTYRDDNPNGDIHLRYHTFSMRERLERANGTAANHVSLVEDMRYGGFSTNSPMLRQAIMQMDRWLSNIAADPSEDSPIDKLLRARPATLVEGCNTRDDEPRFIAEVLDRDPSGECEQLYPSASFPREVAGESVAADVIKCQLRTPDPADYTTEFGATEWERLEAIFPDGVCDYSIPGVEQQGLTGTWLRF